MNLAVYLAIAGNGVVAATHAYDNFQDESGSGTASVIRGRAETISEAIDRILALYVVRVFGTKGGLN